ncbi:aminopeptidase N-like [Thrips palmi]|uniref:Aminopeptidase N-like n=1 Tax=Thrips palmi TaxID=161013 RepID=A0A6P8ZNC7_THRPL|nr:aminopeptidase N-like [Thrips palmi]
MSHSFGKSWTEQVGYPVLTAVRDYERNTVLVYQAPYPLPGATGDDSRSWWVPLKLTSNTVDDLDPDENLISAEQPVVETWGPDTSKEWLLVNSDQMGYYRVNYDMFNWLRLIRAFKEDADNKLPSESSRAMLLDDALSLAAQGLLEYPVALRLMEALLVRERLPAPWIVAGRHLEHLAKFFRGASSKHEVAFDRWVRSLVEGAFADLGFPDDADEVLSALPTGALRGLVAKIACQAKHPECAAAARGQYLLCVSGDSLALAVCHGVTGPWARPEALSTTIALLTGENGADVMQGLGCLSGQQRTDLIQSLVAGTRDMSVTKMAWKAITSGQTGLRLALDALLQNCDLIIKRFGSTFYAEILSDLAPSITTDAHLDALRELASHLNSLSHDSEIAAAAVSVAEDNVAWRKLYLDSVFDEVSSFDADPQGQAQGLSVLPNKVIPTNYALRLATAPQHADDPKKVQSSVEISVTVAEDTDLVSFHSGKGLALQHIAVTDGENEALFHWYNNNLWDGFDEFTMYSEESEMVSVRLDAPMLADKTYTVAIEFVPGYDVLAGDAEGGLFLSTLPDGVSTVTGARMEPNNAHRVFPCFDEPQFLATFSLTLAVTGTPKEALFVSPQKSISQDPAMPDTTIVDFETTRALPAHLLSLAAFDALATATARPSQPVPSGDTATVSSVRARTEVQTATPGAAKQAAALLELLDGALFERPPLARQEILAVPRLQGGPIISPGLAILREGDVLVVDKVSSSEQAVHAALAMANAQAHSFFGNDIMFEGWNSLWFREGLAAYLESWAVDKLNSGEYGAVNRAGVDRVHRGLALAAMETAAPLASAQGDLANRGLGVVRMVAGLLGEKALFNGLQAVLLDGPAKLSHVEVLQTLQAAADQPPPVDLVQLAESWTSQAGFPVLTLSRNYDDGTGFLRQEHFEWDAASRDAPDDRTWIVPYNVLTAKTAKTDPAPLLTEVLTTRSATVSLTGERGDVYMVLNAGQPGFYRVNYDSQNWQLLTKAAAAGELGEAQRATLLDDAVALCRAGRLDVAVVMDLLKAVTAVPQGAPLCVPCWTAARDALTTLGHLTRADPAHRAMYKRFVKEKLVNPSPVQWSALAGEDWAHGAMRAVVTQLACAAEDDVCLSEAKAALLDWQSNKDAFSVGVDPNVLAATICYMMSRAPAATDFTEVNVRITSTEDSSARRAYIAGLGCVRDEDMRSTLLKTTAAKSGVDISDVLPMFVSIMDNSDAPLAQVVDFVAENFDAMTENLGQDVANAVLYAVAERAHEDRHYSKLLSLVDGSASSSTSSSASVQAAVRRAAASRAWSATWQYKLVAWVYEQLDEVPPPDPEPTTPATTPASTTRPASTTPGVTTRPTTQSPTRPTTRPTTHRPTTQRPTTQPTPRPTTHKPNSAAAASTSVLALLLTALLVLLR